MAAGCPVLLSDQTPWRGLEKEKAGWDIPLAREAEITGVIQKMIHIGQSEFDTLSQGALEYARKVIHNPEAIAQNQGLFAS